VNFDDPNYCLNEKSITHVIPAIFEPESTDLPTKAVFGQSPIKLVGDE